MMAPVNGDPTVPEETIYGHVYDSDTGNPVSGAWVRCEGKTETTDAEGYYAIEGGFAPSTSYTLTCYASGYPDSSKTVTTDSYGKEDLDFYLGSEPSPNDRESFIVPTIIAEEPEISTAAIEWRDKGLDYKDAGDYEEAIACYDRATEIDPLYKEAWNSKGIALRHLGEYYRGIECYDKAIEIDPLYEKAWNNKGIALRHLGEYYRAIECYDKAIEIDPLYEKAWNNKGVSFEHLGKYDDAIECYDRAIEIDPHYEKALTNKADLLDKPEGRGI
jgi:tetratricopeptide (TPR) repeat protein